MPTAAQLRSGIGGLTTLAARELDALWDEVTDAVQLRDALQDVLPGLIETYGAAAATLAADWYDDLRVESGVVGTFTATPVEVGPSGGGILARWGVGPLFSQTPDAGAAQSLIVGGLQRRIADASRQTVMLSSLADPAATGWQRETDGRACAFCHMLAGRGSVYSKVGADFASHDKCGCSAVPAFAGLPRPVQPYTPSSRNITDADRARVREYIRTH